MSNFKNGDIVVRTTESHLNIVVGDIREVNHQTNMSLVLRGEKGEYAPYKFRLATEREIFYYTQGIKNIKDIPKQNIEEIDYLTTF